MERLDPEKQFRFGGWSVLSLYQTPLAKKYFNQIFDIQDTHLYTLTLELGFLLFIQFTAFPKCQHPSPSHFMYRRAYYMQLALRTEEKS